MFIEEKNNCYHVMVETPQDWGVKFQDQKKLYPDVGVTMHINLSPQLENVTVSCDEKREKVRHCERK